MRRRGTEAGSSGRAGKTHHSRSALNMLMWFATTLRSYPEIALFLSLAIGYYVGGFVLIGASPWGRSHRHCSPPSS